MYSHTKKVGSLGRYGPRVGRKIRHEARKIEDELKKPKNCPQCGKTRIKRQASGIWSCTPCGLVFAGGAYTPVAVKKEVQVLEEKGVSPAETPKKAVKEKPEQTTVVEPSGEKPKFKEGKKPVKTRKTKEAEEK